ncbi:carboxylesterase family protein [Paraglaciecola aquimarina]|uniref:Carboxylic ester hydrolase n=1 Tax=Paraglaciecola algarum TaxID=3050085 RepID=A0ABS9DF96_9ALTE|nr:carboxylesterase family protein [Paraglaciecola sp. G1-23]MCF2950276.1 carboxylesterase family protein [Paraglaciecola sp. G1-23]
MQFVKAYLILFTLLGCYTTSANSQEKGNALVRIKQGELSGSLELQKQVRAFKGIPYAAAPVGDLRWQPPQQAAVWHGTRNAQYFGHKCMQNPMFSDMQFRDAGTSEDCLFLNVWTPAKKAKNLPVLVYFYGGGFAAGDGSEKRYDGANMAKQGIVTVTVNYRLGIFGLFAHPQLSTDSGYQGSGNYTFMDQAAALKWVSENIQSFGGDPKRVTIAGESAGSFSVSALMASPLSRQYINGAIGESGSFLAGRLNSLEVAEKKGEEVAKSILSGLKLSAKDTISALKELSAQELLDAATKAKHVWFTANVDNYVIPKTLTQMYAQGDYAKVPLLAGNNSQEGSYQSVLGNRSATVENYKQALEARYPNIYGKMLELYPAKNEEQVKDAAQAIASDEFISLSTWNWMDLVTQTNSQATFFYNYTHVRPLMKAEYWSNSWKQSAARGATHSAEIEYALGNLDINPLYEWKEQDYKVSKIVQQYFANFIKTGNPNGKGLANWPMFKHNQQLIINNAPFAENVDYLRVRYTGLNKLKN